MANILFIVGSFRKGSFNGQVAKLAEGFIGDRATVSYLDYSDVPFINQDEEFPAPAAVARLRQTVADADAVWVFTPEYNYSYPGVLKNAIDWLSRPVDPANWTAPTVLAGKLFTASAAGGKLGGSKSLEKLNELLNLLGAKVADVPQTAIALNSEAWTEDKMILTDEQKQEVKAQAEALLKTL
ncbi:MAG: NAD(P)H-dependent oxidoreductase [Prevotella sp.]|nr:NAD(P)H-dependent oxidoreductase [Prevotella sp.]